MVFERRRRPRLKAEVVEAPPAEHWRLSVGLGVADDLEDIEHGGRANLNEGEPHAPVHGVVEHGRVEHVPIEGVEPIRVLSSKHRHVIDSGQ